MNTLLAPLPPLPAALEHPGSTGARQGQRHRIGDLMLQPSDVENFNQLLYRLGRQQPPLDCDCLATAARELMGSECNGALACVRHRVRRGRAMGAMIGDTSWEPLDDAAAIANQVIDYLRDPQDLIPDELPRVGLLDDAIVVDTVWTRLVPELARYLDFRRLRRLEAALRGTRAFAFRRGDWEQARLAEAALAAHRRAVRDGSYLASGPALFRIH